MKLPWLAGTTTLLTYVIWGILLDALTHPDNYGIDGL